MTTFIEGESIIGVDTNVINPSFLFDVYADIIDLVMYQHAFEN